MNQARDKRLRNRILSGLMLLAFLTVPLCKAQMAPSARHPKSSEPSEPNVTHAIGNSVLTDPGQALKSLIETQWNKSGRISFEDVVVERNKMSYTLDVKGKKTQRIYNFAETPYFSTQINKYIGDQMGHMEWLWGVHPPVKGYEKLCWDNEGDANKFVTVTNRLIQQNSPEGVAQRQAEEAKAKALQQQVATWRAAGAKVEVPEEARRHFVLAQQAFQEKDFQHQGEELSAALQIYPTWPAEQFDLALVLGELNRYSEAIQHMQMYLTLTPDAPDAQRAKQQIWIWQDKTGGGNN
jgi:hypothetical protein